MFADEPEGSPDLAGEGQKEKTPTWPRVIFWALLLYGLGLALLVWEDFLSHTFNR